jgi:hypothetical protein
MQNVGYGDIGAYQGGEFGVEPEGAGAQIGDEER